MGMRARLGVVASIVTVAAVLASCGLAPVGTPALVPPAAVQHRTEALVPADLPPPADAPAAAHEPAALHKVVLPESAVVPAPTLASATTSPMKHIWQSLNNCGPAAVVMALSTLGVDADQETARLALRGENVNRGMGPGPVGPWVEEQFGLRMMYRTGGTNALLKALVSNGFAPMVTQWMQDPWVSRISHWRTVQGYDDARATFYVNDSMLGRGVPLAYDWFARNWQPFSYRYMVLYRPSDEARLQAIVGPQWDDRTMRRTYYERAKDEAHAQGTSQAWLAYGEAAYQYGMFAEAVEAIEKGMSLGSATGVFMLRSSLPNALRALGRFAEADAAQARLSNITPGVSPASSPTTFRLDPAIEAIVAERELEARADALAERRLRRADPSR